MAYDEDEPRDWRDMLDATLDEVATRIRLLERERHELAEKLHAAVAGSEQRRQEIQRLQAIKEPVVMSDGDKADVEAAFQRGVEHARGNLGVSKYSANRKGILLIGEVASMLARASDVLNDAVSELSTDETVVGQAYGAEMAQQLRDDEATAQGTA